MCVFRQQQLNLSTFLQRLTSRQVCGVVIGREEEEGQRSFTVNYRYLHTQRTNMYMLRVSMFNYHQQLLHSTSLLFLLCNRKCFSSSSSPVCSVTRTEAGLVDRLDSRVP